ncbi:recombinase family protein [Mesorhizobium sp. M0701]|uniref:recombinase family protein n=1 Tax=Mesorhizobium sp. M0701 TaxID=2956989 RepID=UPI0033393782
MSKNVLYMRVSTVDQNIRHQRQSAEAKGYRFNEEDVIADEGVSGVSTLLRERPGGRRLFDILREGDTLVVRHTDRLGRNYEDITETIREFMKKGVIIKTTIGDLTFDGATKDPMQKAFRDGMIGFMAASAQSQVESTKEAQKAGIEAAKAIPDKYRGRKPTFTRNDYTTVQAMLATGNGASAIAKATGLQRQTVIRMRDNPANVEQTLANWRM